jgi:acyl carrier protein
MTLEYRVIETVSKNLEKPQEVRLESNLQEDLGVDSFNKIMIIAGLEDEFSININGEDFSEIKTVSDIVDNLRLKYPGIEGD